MLPFYTVMLQLCKWWNGAADILAV